MRDQTEREALTDAIQGNGFLMLNDGETAILADAILAAGFHRTSTQATVTTVEGGLYGDVTLADWKAWARDHDQWELPPGSDQVDERTVEFAVALANAFGPTDDTRADSHVEVVSWFMEDAIECIEHVPAGPIRVTKVDATHGNYTFVIVVNGFVFVVPDEEGDIYLEPLCPLPATVLTPATPERTEQEREALLTAAERAIAQALRIARETEKAGAWSDHDRLVALGALDHLNANIMAHAVIDAITAYEGREVSE